MSLNWDATNTAAFTALGDNENYTDHQHDVLDMLIWGSLMLDLPGIPKEEDAEEFIFRARFASRLGIWAYSEVPGMDDIKEWVGLTTNVARKTRHQYIQKASKQVRRAVETSMQRSMQREEVKA